MGTRRLQSNGPFAPFPGGLEPPQIRVVDDASSRHANSASSNMNTAFEATHTIKRNAIIAGNRALTLNELLRQNVIQGVQKEIFWSEASLRRIITEERISAQLEGSHPPSLDIQCSPSNILANHFKIFAILTMLGKHDDIYRIVEEGVSDRSLPLQMIDSVSCSILFNGQVALCFEDGWSHSDRDGFIRFQHQVNPVFLGSGVEGTVRHEDFDDSVVLPITHDEPIGSAGYGAVFKLKLHPECHNFQDVLPSINTNECFAVKRLLPRRNGDFSAQSLGFDKEVKALQRLNGRVNEHIVTLLMTWTIKGSVNDKYCLLFPWADGDLLWYWQKHPHPCVSIEPNQEAIQWVAKQIKGIASALETIHSPRYKRNLEPKEKYGRHGDIKAENILWYPPSAQNPRGILVVADLGLTCFNSTQSRSNVPGEGIPVTPGYRPPECDLDGGKFSRAFDVWTFGCLILEMVCWTLGGNQNREAFQDYRETPGINGVDTDIFFDVLFKGPKTASQDGPQTSYSTDSSASTYFEHAIAVKGEVLKWIADLHKHPMCTRYLHELLDLVEQNMIVVLAPGHGRMGSAALHNALNGMYRRVCDPDDSYGRKSCPEERSIQKHLPVDALLSSHAYGLVKSRHAKIKSYIGKTHTSVTRDQLSAME